MNQFKKRKYPLQRLYGRAKCRGNEEEFTCVNAECVAVANTIAVYAQTPQRKGSLATIEMEGGSMVTGRKSDVDSTGGAKGKNASLHGLEEAELRRGGIG